MRRLLFCLIICLLISQSASADYILSTGYGDFLIRITNSGRTVWETTELYNNFQPELAPGDDSFAYTAFTNWGGGVDGGVNQFNAVTGALLGSVTVNQSGKSIYDVQWGADYNRDGFDDVWTTGKDGLFEVYDGATFGTVLPDTPLATWGIEDVEPCDGTGGSGLLFGPDLTGDGISELYATKGYSNRNNNINVWDIVTMTKVATYPISEAKYISSIILGPDVNGDGREDLWVVSGGTDEILAIDYMNGTNYGAVNLGIAALFSPSDVDYGPNGTVLITTQYATSLDPDYAGDRTDGGNLIKYDPATGISTLIYEHYSFIGSIAYIPSTINSNIIPFPLNGATDVPRDVVLSWRPMTDYADKYNVYLGTDINDVNQASVKDPRDVLVSQSRNENTYDPAGLLEYDQAYYWRIDEVNDTEPNIPLKGDVWNFTTTDFFVVVEDFEDYNDYPPDEIWNTWLDGYGDPTNGSTAGYPEPDFIAGEHYMETTIVHGGEQSMPLFYDNSAGLSEVTRNLGDDWTQNGVVTLTMWYYGSLSNNAEPMYVALNGDAAVTNNNPNAALAVDWTLWEILLQDFVDMGVDLTSVNAISLGFGNKVNPVAGGSGHVFFDDIRLSRALPVNIEPIPEPVDPGTDNLVASYSFENNVRDDSGNGLNGTIFGNPEFVEGISGMGLSLDGVNDYVDFGNDASFDITEQITLSAWINANDIGNGQHNPFVGKGNNAYAIKHSSDNEIQFFIYDGDWFTANFSVDDSFNGRWHFVAGTYDGNELRIYFNGVLADTTAHAGSIETQTHLLTIGTNSQAAGRFYNGAIDEVKIYNRALSEPEIRFLVGR